MDPFQETKKDCSCSAAQKKQLVKEELICDLDPICGSTKKNQLEEQKILATKWRTEMERQMVEAQLNQQELNNLSGKMLRCLKVMASSNNTMVRKRAIDQEALFRCLFTKVTRLFFTT